ncbi:MAG: hypothetical protein B6A08_04925 [Sorangiineae bacterium NIC37A_2]|jgi:hypothetical protein|nr:MAG: hypothetical protein B6A08_04925 [Sorangiineae bacterium NIC37A_2]
MGLALFAVVILSFASWLTCHAILCARMAKLSPLGALLSFIVFPLAPFRAASMPRTRLLWILLLVLYGGSLWASFREPTPAPAMESSALGAARREFAVRPQGSADERDLPKCRRHAIARARSAGVT